MTYPASTIAFALVKKAVDENIYISQQQLQKMMYFANGYHLARYGRPLVAENFEAWKNGPVIPSLFRLYIFYGSEKIFTTSRIQESQKDRDNLKLLNDEALHVINYTIKTISELSEKDWGPWAHSFLAPWARSNSMRTKTLVISSQSIAEHFSKFLIRE